MMKTFRIVVAILLFFAALSASSSYPNDTLVADYGRTVAPVKTNEIRMTEEEVVIRIDDFIDKSAAFPLRRAYVECTFWFKNNSAKLIEATVGFPGNEQNTIAMYSEPIADFVTVMDGQRFNIDIKKELLSEDKKYNVQVFRNWYTWNMKFPGNSAVTVKNTYLYYLSSASNYDPFYLKYELATGANWKGKIGKATIRVIYKDVGDLEKRVCEIHPKGWVIRGSEIVWDLQNFKPTQADNISCICQGLAGQSVPLSAKG